MRNVAFRSVESVTQEVVESRDSVSLKKGGRQLGGRVELSQPGEHAPKRKGHQRWQ